MVFQKPVASKWLHLPDHLSSAHYQIELPLQELFSITDNSHLEEHVLFPPMPKEKMAYLILSIFILFRSH